MENNKNMTAVDWLINELENHYVNIDLKNIVAYTQAKQMEKDKIRESYYRGVKDEMQNIGKDFEDYYNETYGK